MSRKPNKTREAYIKKLPERAELLKESTKNNIVFNFKFFISERMVDKVSRIGRKKKFYLT